jgi:hypothetical protein
VQVFNNRVYSTVYSRMTRSLQLQPAIAGKLAVSLQNVVHGYSLCLAGGKTAQKGLSVLT